MMKVSSCLCFGGKRESKEANKTKEAKAKSKRKEIVGTATQMKIKLYQHSQLTLNTVINGDVPVDVLEIRHCKFRARTKTCTPIDALHTN